MYYCKLSVDYLPFSNASYCHLLKQLIIAKIVSTHQPDNSSWNVWLHKCIICQMYNSTSFVKKIVMYYTTIRRIRKFFTIPLDNISPYMSHYATRSVHSFYAFYDTYLEWSMSLSSRTCGIFYFPHHKTLSIQEFYL